MKKQPRVVSQRSRFTGLLLGCLLLIGTPTHAQTALKGRARSPLKLSKSGSYQLVEDLEVKSGDALEVLADHVSIDLNGFSIIGPGVNSPNAEIGINASGHSFVTVSHGAVLNFKGSGIVLGDNAVIKGVHSDGNGALGIFCKSDCAVSDSTASNNGAQGIVAGASSVITGNIVNGNQNGVGITVGRNSSVSGNIANGNAG